MMEWLRTSTPMISHFDECPRKKTSGNQTLKGMVLSPGCPWLGPWVRTLNTCWIEIFVYASILLINPKTIVNKI